MRKLFAQHISSLSPAGRYALLAFAAHALVIGASLIPGWRHQPLLSGDAITYYLPAQNLLEHGVFSREQAPPYLWEPYRTPGYPVLIAITHAVTGWYGWVLFLAAFSAAGAAWSAVRLVQHLGVTGLSLHLAGLLASFLPNSLGLSGQMLTDALTGHLFLVWLYFMVLCLKNQSGMLLLASVGLLLFLQSLKPTFNTSFVLIIVLLWLFAKRPLAVVPSAGLLTVSLLLPVLLAFQNERHHGVRSASLLGIETIREYLMTRALAKDQGKEYGQMTLEVREEDRAEASRLRAPLSLYGRLYAVKKAKVLDFFREQPLRVAGLAISEMARQCLAPQEFVFQLFKGDLPIWGRMLGSLFTGLLWVFAFWGGVYLWKEGSWQPAVLLLAVLLYFLATASVSHLVGARLRFPADMSAIPLIAIGLGQFHYVLGKRIK